MVTANGEVQTYEEAQVYVHDLDLFVTVQILDDTPAVQSLGKLCEEHGYSCEWSSGQKPHLTKQEKNIFCKTENFVPLVVPGMSTNSGTSSSSTSPQDSSSTSSSPATERRDDLAPGNWRDESISFFFLQQSFRPNEISALRWLMCAANVNVCVMKEWHASAPVQAGLVRTLPFQCRREIVGTSAGTLAIDVRLSDTAVSPLLHRCCTTVVALCLPQATVFSAVRLLLAAHKFV